MIRILRNVSLLVIVCLTAMILSCNAPKTTYKMLIISAGTNSPSTGNNLFSGYFLLNNNPYDFSTTGSLEPPPTAGTVYYAVELTDIVKESDLSTIIISVTGNGNCSSVQYYLYKTKDSNTDLVDSASALSSTDSSSNFTAANIYRTYKF